MAAEVAYTGTQAPVEEMRKAFERRRDLIVSLAKDVPGFEINKPEGAFYLFPKCSYYFGKTDGQTTIMYPYELCYQRRKDRGSDQTYQRCVGKIKITINETP